MSARDIQYGDGQWFRGKNFETFCPVGPSEPVPASELGDGSGLRVVQKLNGRVLQDGNTDDLIFDVPYLVAFASAVFTLEPATSSSRARRPASATRASRASRCRTATSSRSRSRASGR